MRVLRELIRRQKTVIILMFGMLILPGVLISVLAFRSIRAENLQSRFQERERQRQIVLLMETDLKGWLFSPPPRGAIADSLLKFNIDGDRIVFPDFQFAVPPERPANPEPFASKNSPRNDDAASDPDAPIDVGLIEDIYYPRIQAFLRDFRANKNSGAQYFRRLKAMIVQIPGTMQGYVLPSTKLIEYSNRKLDELTRSEDFGGVLSIAETGEPVSSGSDFLTLSDFTFFQVGFTGKSASSQPDIRRNLLFYSMILLILVIVAGIVFTYRAVSHELAVSQLRADFVSAVSHEFRTPLSSMLALVERLRSGHVSDGEMLRRYYDSLEQEARRLGLLINKLMDFAQLEAGKKEFTFENVELNELAAEAIHVFQQSRFGERIKQMEIDALPQVHVMADRTAIVHCIQNLIENALKYSPPESDVEIRCGRDGAVPFIEVLDRGIGVDRPDRERIFDKFYRAGNARALNVQGTGIGLALVMRIMKSHRGTVVVAERPGGGSSFRLEFAKLEGAA